MFSFMCMVEFNHIALPVSFYTYVFETVLYKYMDVYLNNL